jgi:DNA-binding PadR family transcriptional regulator
MIRHKIPLVLLLLRLLDTQPSYSYDLGKCLELMGYHLSNHGPYVRMLHLLEHEGLVTASRCIPKEGPRGERLEPGQPRKVYQLTERGRMHLQVVGR